MKYYQVVWSVMLLGWLTLYASRMVFSPCVVSIMDEFQITHVEASLLVSAYFYPYVVMQFVAGHLGDRLGRKRVLEIGYFASALISFLMGFSDVFIILLLLRALFGFAQGFYFANDRSIISYYTPKEKMGIGQALGFIGGGLGLTLGIILGGFLTQIYNWRFALSFMSIPLLSVAILIWKLVKEPPSQEGESGQGARGTTYWEVFRNRDLWLVSFANFSALYPFWTISTWAPKALLDAGIPTLADASIFSSLFGLSALPGLLVVGLMIDVAKKSITRKMISSASFILVASLAILTGFGLQYGFAVWTLALLIFVGGMFNWGLFTVLYTTIAEICPPKIYGTAFGFFNAVGFLSSFTAPVIAGWLKDIAGSFSYGFYIAGITAMLGCMAMSMVQKPLSCTMHASRCIN